MHTADSNTQPAANSPRAPEAKAWIDYGVSRRVNPTGAELRELALAHTPHMLTTSFGNLNKVSRNKARMAKHTYVITDGSADAWSHKTLSRADADALIEQQAAYIRESGELIEVQGWLGVGPRAVPVQWLYTVEGANIAGMQSVLSFPRERVEGANPGTFAPAFRVVYTPDFRPNVPGGQRILVDLDNYVTYVMGPDSFGESKKGALRMLCHRVHHQGGLVLHAGAKEVLLESGDRLTVAILGLSGTGKTTTTFSKQGSGVKPVQDDMVALWPEGELSVTENGCFAKTFGLTEATEPVLYRATISKEAWLENAYQNNEGIADFSKGTLDPDEVAALADVLVATGANAERVARYAAGEVPLSSVLDEQGIPLDGWDFVSWTENGRSIVPLSAVEDAANLDDLPPVRSMGVLNRDEGAGAITPGIVRFSSPEQAAGYFMLGETTKTSAAGKERGRTRSPFTQPFYPGHHGEQAARFAEILATTKDISTWLMNTGYVGGDHGDGTAIKVKIRHSSAMLEALFAGHIAWKRDTDFGYDVVDVEHPDNAALVEAVGVDILRPDLYYKRTGRNAIYAAEVAERHQERAAFLRSYEVTAEIIAAVIPG